MVGEGNSCRLYNAQMPKKNTKKQKKKPKNKKTKKQKTKSIKQKKTGLRVNI
jgi:hypothetical protein